MMTELAGCLDEIGRKHEVRAMIRRAARPAFQRETDPSEQNQLNEWPRSGPGDLVDGRGRIMKCTGGSIFKNDCVKRGARMRHQLAVAMGARVVAIAVVSLAQIPITGQTPLSSPKAPAAADKRIPPHTPDGQPDLQGIWTNGTITPLERPRDLDGKQFLTPEEATALEKQVVQSRIDRPPLPGDPGGYNEFWWERGTKVVRTRRTSLVVDPQDGRIPPLTAEAQGRLDNARATARQHPADGPENRSLQERCLLWQTAGPPMLPAGYNNTYQIVQAPGYIMILTEMIHDARIIPIDGRPHLPPKIRQWMGDSRGRWEGNTLVVDTTNFTAKTGFRGSSQNLHLVERLTRVDPDTLLYEFTVDDPETFTKIWRVELPMTKSDGPIFEYACNEGNYALTDILAGARAEEKAAAEAAKQDSK